MNVIKPYLRGWPIIIGFMVIANLLASKYLNYVTPMYESTAMLKIADLNEGVPNSNLFKDFDVFATVQKINAEIELLKSDVLLEKALNSIPFDIEIFRVGKIQKTELFEDSPILITPLKWQDELRDKPFQLLLAKDLSFTLTSSKGSTYKGKLGDIIFIDNSQIHISLNKPLLQKKKYLMVPDHYEFNILSRSKQIADIDKHIDITAVDKDIPVIRISFKSPNAKKASIFPNALAHAYIQDYIETKYSAANVTSQFLDERIKEISDKLTNTENNIMNYRNNEGITNISQETETDLRKISQLKIQQTNLKMSLEAIKDLEQYINSGKDNFLELAPNFEAFTDLLSTEIIKNIKQLQAEKKDLLLKFTVKDDKVKVIDAKIKDLTSYLIESISNTRKNLETKYRKLIIDIEDAEKVFVTVPEKEKKMTILNREFNIYQQSYNFLNQKKIESDIVKAAKVAFHRIITPASESKMPVSPNRTIIKIVSTLLGLFAALFVIFIVHMLKARVNNISSIESQSLIPIALAIPKLKSIAEINNVFTKTVFEWEVKKLITPKSIVCFTSFNQKHGVDFITRNIQKIFVDQNRKILRVEFSDESSNSNQFWTEFKQENLQTLIKIDKSLLKKVTTENWQNWLVEKSKEFDQTIIVNTVFGTSFTISTMTVSDLNIVCTDARLTPSKSIVEVDVLKEEFKLPNVYWALNRAGYNPSFIRECIQFSINLYRKIKDKKNAITKK